MSDGELGTTAPTPRGGTQSGPPLRNSLLWGLLVLLLLVDLTLVAAHVSRGLWQEPTSRLFDLTVENGYGELFQAIKGAWSVVILLFLVWWRRSWLYLGWAAVCVYLVADDGLSLHERAGSWVARTLGDGSQAAAHAGELVFVGITGALVVPLVIASWITKRSWDRKWLRLLVLAVALLAVFGIAVDALHSFVFRHHTLALTMTTIEDGGEIIATSLILATVVAGATLSARGRTSRAQAEAST